MNLIVQKIGVTQVLYLFLLLLWPISKFILPKIKSKKLNCYFHIFFGFLMCYILFNNKIIFALLTAIISYFFLDKRPFYVFILGLTLNSFTHLYYYFFSGIKSWSMEITGTCMVIFQKIISISYNIYDGNLKDKKIDELVNNYSLKEKPSFLEWIAYCFTPYGGTTGPFYEFKVFNLILTSFERPLIKSNSKDRLISIKKYFSSFIYAIISLIGFKYANLNTYKTEFYLNLPLIIRCIFSSLITFLQAIKYFSVWSAVEAGLFELGLGQISFIGYDSISNLSIFDVLSSESLSIWLQKWNHTTHLFWKKYLFIRLKSNGYGSTIAVNSVLLISAFWHGFKPVYYLFLPESLIGFTIDKFLNNFKFKSKFYKIFRNIYTVFVMLGYTSAWWSSTSNAFFYIRKTYFWIPQILPIFIYLIFKYLIKRNFVK